MFFVVYLKVINEHGTRYNIPLLNALVLFVGSQHIAAIRARGQTPSVSTIAHTSHMDIFQNLAVDLDTEGRYLFLNALANQLRFPSSHTHYFSLVILYLFAHSNTEVVQVRYLHFIYFFKENIFLRLRCNHLKMMVLD